MDVGIHNVVGLSLERKDWSGDAMSTPSSRKPYMSYTMRIYIDPYDNGDVSVGGEFTMYTNDPLMLLGIQVPFEPDTKALRYTWGITEVGKRRDKEAE